MADGDGFGSGSSSAGGFATGIALTVKGGKKAREFAREQSARARQFTREVGRHKYQWAVRDLKAAGLNPILAATGGLSGGGGSAPIASAGQNLEGGAVAAGAMGASAAQQYRRFGEELRLIQQQTKESDARTKEAFSRALLAGQQDAMLSMQLPYARALGDFYRSEEGKALARWGERVRVYGPGASAAGSLVPVGRALGAVGARLKAGMGVLK